MTVDLSAFYFDIRKDALYCDPYSSVTRKAALTVIDQLFRCTVTWLAPMLCFTAEEAWLARYPGEETSVHLELFPELPGAWRDDALAEKWRKVRDVRRVVTGALELERAGKAHRLVARSSADRLCLRSPICSPRWSTSISPRLSITSAATLVEGEGPAEAFRLDDVPGVAVVPRSPRARSARARGKSRRASAPIRDYPDVTPRDAQALREWDAIARRRSERGDDAQMSPRLRDHCLRPVHALADRRARRLRDRSGREALAAQRVRSRQPRHRAPHAVPRPRAHLEHRHQLRPVPAGERFRPLCAARAQSRRRRWCCGSGLPGRNRG